MVGLRFSNLLLWCSTLSCLKILTVGAHLPKNPWFYLIRLSQLCRAIILHFKGHMIYLGNVSRHRFLELSLNVCLQ